MKRPGADIFHAVRYLRFLQCRRISEYLSLYPPNPFGNAHFPSESPVTGQNFFLFHRKTAHGTVKNQAYRLRNPRIQNIAVRAKSPCLSPEHRRHKARTARKGVLPQTNLALLPQKYDFFQAAAIFKGMGFDAGAIRKCCPLQVPAALKGGLPHHMYPAEIKTFQLSAAVKAIGLHRPHIRTDTFLQRSAALKKPLRQNCFSDNRYTFQ